MPVSSKILWKQADRESAAEQARRVIHQAEAPLDALGSLYESHLDDVRSRPDMPPMLGRVFLGLHNAIQAAQTLMEAYDYFLARCTEAGLSPEDAVAAWQAHSREAFAAALVEAEAVGPSAMRMIDETILARLGIAP